MYFRFSKDQVRMHYCYVMVVKQQQRIYLMGITNENVNNGGSDSNNNNNNNQNNNDDIRMMMLQPEQFLQIIIITITMAIIIM